MSRFGEPYRIPTEYSTGVEPSLMQQDPVRYSGPQSPLVNLSMVKNKMDTLHHFLSQSLNTNTLISKYQMDHVSSEIATALHQIIVNGAALLSTVQKTHFSNTKLDEGESNIIELDSVELLLSEKYKTPAALAKKLENGSEVKNSGRKTRFSCPYGGCNRNKRHDRFRPLKSVISERNHFKRSHCPKMYGCNRCHKERFSILGDLRIHLKNCSVGARGEESTRKCKCNRGNSICRKDKPFRHLSLFEGHIPAVETEEEGDRKLPSAAAIEGKEEELTTEREGCLENGLFDGLLDGFGSFENYCLQDLLGPSS